MNNNVEFGSDTIPTRIIVHEEPSAIIKFMLNHGVSSIEKANMILLGISVVFIIITIISYINIFSSNTPKSTPPAQVQVQQ